MANPTYQSGFYAPGRGTALHPELWDGCVGAWDPGLGPTGGTLRDWSGRGNHGTLTNMDPATDWVVSQGRHALDFDGTDDCVLTSGSGPLATLTHNTKMTVTLWFCSNNLSSFRNLLIKRLAGSPTAFNIFTINSQIAFSQWDGSNDRSSGAVGFLVVDRWYHAALVSTGSGLIGYLDGKAIGASTTSLTPSSNSDGVTFGRDPLLGRYFSGKLRECSIYNQALSPQEIRTLAQRPGIAYERAPRKFYSLPAAASSRQYRLFRPAILRGA